MPRLNWRGRVMIEVKSSPFLIEATAHAGVDMLDAHGALVARTPSDAPRYAAYIQAARDRRDYASADIYRRIVERFGLEVRQEKTSTTVREGARVKAEQQIREERAKHERARKGKRND